MAAKDFATVAHSGQFRKGIEQQPYTVHLAEVAATVAEFGGTPDAVAAAWLHDTVEDCGTSPDEISAIFGPTVAALVAELTDDKSLQKADRKRLQIVNAAHKSSDAALIKICDKMSNARAVGMSPPVHWPVARQVAYLDWAESVVAALPPGWSNARVAFSAQVVQSRAQIAKR